MKKRKKRLVYWIYNILFLLSCSLFCSSLFIFITWMNDNKKTDDLTSTILKDTDIKTIEDNNKTENVNPPIDLNDDYWNYIKTPLMSVDFISLLEKNSDTAFWINVKGTNINYPVVQTNDNKYYLTHAFNKKRNDAGWLFVDYRNNLINLDDNTIIYGHGRWNKTMFGSLRNILLPSWQENKDNRFIQVSTKTENTLWQVFSVYDIVKESYYLTNDFFGNTKEKQSFFDTLLSRSKYDFKTSLNSNDKILTLSTCKGDDEWRIVLHAKLIKKEKR